MPSKKNGAKKQVSPEQAAMAQKRKDAKKAAKQAGSAAAVRKLKNGCASRGGNAIANMGRDDPIMRHCMY